ncbi:MAG: T9SS type A sorting domain-containing protein [Bacteroidales bacterium]|jgi:hypothetical protein|nr:T9SS type A sorting domain-containing protein [Bacteroidales bacterium]
MKRIIILILVLLASETFLSAQVTRTQADATVRKYLQDEMIAYSLLYVYADEPNEEGISITTSNDETFKVKYACWAYYADESETAQRRYLFVRESNENLLEVIASNDLSSDPDKWNLVETSSVIEREDNNIKLYPNPVNDWLTIPYIEKYTRIEIHDLKGVSLFSEKLTDEESCYLNVSFLATGVYFVSLYNNEKISVFKIIKN